MLALPSVDVYQTLQPVTQTKVRNTDSQSPSKNRTVTERVTTRMGKQLIQGNV